MSTKKTIQINPELFKLSGNKTRRNKEKKELTLTPIVSPNNLKNKLLKRIKDHKSQEIKGGQNTMSKNVASKESDKNYTDEFYGAIDYLSDLTKKHKAQKYTIEARQRAINSKTLKNHDFSPSASNISLELPEELEEPKLLVPQTDDIISMNYKQDDVPYGCLKGGKKKTYREWKELTKPDAIDLPDVVRPPTPPKKNIGMFLSGATPMEQNQVNQNQNNLSREERLTQIKNKLKMIQDKESTEKQQLIENFKNLEKEYSAPIGIPALTELPDFDQASSTVDIEKAIQESKDNEEKQKTKKYMKQTIKRKFTLGKSDKLRRVSVLIKNRQTRKNILNTQKQLKNTNITDIRKYLREHGIIKVGSTCPADILRKIFESAVLTGEVTNTNKDTLLHNFLSSEN